MGTSALPSSASAMTLGGAFALPDATEKVTAELVVRKIGALTRELLIAFADRATGQPILGGNGIRTKSANIGLTFPSLECL